MELIPETEPVKAFVRVTIPVAHSLEFEISLFRFPSRTVESGRIRKRFPHYCGGFPEVNWQSSGSQRTQRVSALITAPEHPRWEKQNH